MRWDWVRSWSPLALAVLLLGGAAIALELDQVDGAVALGAISCLLTGSWLAVLLHDHYRDHDRGHGDDG